MSNRDIPRPRPLSLTLIRHGESQWNKDNLFCGWVDVDLTDTGRSQARDAARALNAASKQFDLIFTSVLGKVILVRSAIFGGEKSAGN